MSIGGATSSVFNNPQLLAAMLPGYNISALDQAMQAQIAEAEQPLSTMNNQLQTLQGTIGGWQTLQSDLSSLLADAKSLSGSSLYRQISASSTNPTAVGVSTQGSGNPGTYQIGVQNLMQPETVYSAAQSSATSALGQSGSFTVNGQTVQVTSDMTLQQVAQAMNAASAGVTALVLPSGSSYLLSISSVEAQRITWSDPNGILANLGVLNSTGHAFSSTGVGVQSGDTLPVRAQYTINGMTVTSPTNSDSTTIPGVTLNLLAATAAGSPATVTVTQDTQSVVSAAQQFASDYNNLFKDINNLTAPGGRLGPSASASEFMNTIDSTLGAILSGQPGGFQSLSQIGITLQAPVGKPNALTMSVDSSTLTAALSQNPSAVQSLFSGSAGVANVLQQQLNAWVGAGGSVPAKISSLQTQISTISGQLNDPNSPVNLEIRQQTQMAQDQFNQMLSALLSSVSQGQFLQQFINQTSGGSSNQNGGGGG